MEGQTRKTYYVARPRIKRKPRVNLATSQREWWKGDERQSGDASRRKRTVNKSGGAQADCTKESGRKSHLEEWKTDLLSNLTAEISQIYKAYEDGTGGDGKMA